MSGRCRFEGDSRTSCLFGVDPWEILSLSVSSVHIRRRFSRLPSVRCIFVGGNRALFQSVQIRRRFLRLVSIRCRYAGGTRALCLVGADFPLCSAAVDLRQILLAPWGHFLQQIVSECWSRHSILGVIHAWEDVVRLD